MFPQRTMLREHLEHNHYPPIAVTERALDTCEAAIAAFNENDPLRKVHISGLTAAEVVKFLHLDPFLEESS